MLVVFILWGLFDLKHFIADYVLQTGYMAIGKGKTDRWIVPLSAHCAVHALGTAFCLGLAAPYLSLSIFSIIKLVILDFAIHFVMDRIKSSPRLLGRFRQLSGEPTPIALRDNKLFWVCLGLDQWVHHLTNLLIVWLTLGVLTS